MANICDKCGKQLEFLEERTYSTSEGRILKLCLKCYEKSIAKDNQIVSETLNNKNEKILSIAPVLLFNFPHGFIDSKDHLVYFLCFTKNFLLGIYFERYLVPASLYGYIFWQSVHKKELKQKENEIIDVKDDIKKLVESHENNFAINYNEIEEVKFGKKLFSIKLYEKYNSLKMRFDFDISNKKEVKDLFSRFLPTKTFIKKGIIR